MTYIVGGPEDWDEAQAEAESKAYGQNFKLAIACDPHGNGVVLACSDDEVTVNEFFGGAATVVDLDIDEAPAGINIWEGSLVFGSPDRLGDHDAPEFVGKFRKATMEELVQLAAGQNPWAPVENVVLPEHFDERSV